MKKVFISQPFSGRTEEEIFKQRGEIISYLKSVIGDEELYVFDQYHQTEAPSESGSLFYLGNDIHMMSLADIIVFSSDWESAHGCKVERFVAREYGFMTIDVPNKPISGIEFEWSDEEEDPELYNSGARILVVAGRTTSIQNFVKKLSYRIGYKCDFSFTAGRAHIDVLNNKDAISKATLAIQDAEWMSQFLVPYSKESYDNGTYFEILH